MKHWKLIRHWHTWIWTVKLYSSFNCFPSYSSNREQAITLVLETTTHSDSDLDKTLLLRFFQSHVGNSSFVLKQHGFITIFYQSRQLRFQYSLCRDVKRTSGKLFTRSFEPELFFIFDWNASDFYTHLFPIWLTYSFWCGRKRSWSTWDCFDEKHLNSNSVIWRSASELEIAFTHFKTWC